MNVHVREALNQRSNKTIGRDIIPVKPKAPTMSEMVAANGTEPTKRLAFTRASEIRMVPVSFMWDGRVPRGKVTGIEGRMGTGKTTLITAIMAAVTKTGTLPGHSREVPGGAAMMISLEDDAADTLVPRLTAAGADLSRCHLFSGYDFGGEVRDGVLNLVLDMGRLREAMMDLRVVYLGIDPLVAVLGNKISYKDEQEMRAQILAPMKQVAEGTGAAMSFIRHFRKAGGAKEDAGGGSIGIGSSCRSVLRVDEDPETPERFLLSSVKSSVSKKPATLGYRLEEVRITPEITTSRIVWDGESTWTADSLAARSMDGEAGARETEAKEWLRDALASGPRSAKELLRAAESDGIARRTLQRAGDVLGISKKRKGFGEGSEWSLPLHSRQESPFAPSSYTSRMDGTNGADDMVEVEL